MYRTELVLISVVFSILNAYLVICDSEEISLEQDPKIIVNHNTNMIHTKRPHNKPTTAQVQFEPGLPAGWSKPSTKAPKPKGPANPAIAHDYSQKPVFNPDEESPAAKPGAALTHPGVSPPEAVVAESPNKGSVIDSIFEFIGFKPAAGNGDSGNENSLPTPSKICQSQCKCGLTYKNTKIVGGVETRVNEYPWMVTLLYNNRFFCGGSLVNDRYVLTAAHCTSSFDKDKLSVVFLDHDRSTPHETKSFTRRVAAIKKHGSYNQGVSFNNDVALLKLDREVDIHGPHTLLKPVCMPTPGRSFSGHTGIVTGWGAIKQQGPVSIKLREVRVPIVSNTECRKTGYGNRISENMMCAGYPQGMKDSCQGDSGGPLHVANGSEHMIAGIVSWGEGCAEPGYFGVYTRVNRFLTWIRSNTKDACYCN